MQIVSRRRGFTVETCTAAIAAGQESPSFEGLSTGARVSAAIAMPPCRLQSHSIDILLPAVHMDAIIAPMTCATGKMPECITRLHFQSTLQNVQTAYNLHAAHPTGERDRRPHLPWRDGRRAQAGVCCVVQHRL